MTQHSDPSVTLTTSATADLADPLAVQRVRHPLKARQAQVLARHQTSPGFVRLTLGGPEMVGFVSLGFDDHFKLILPAQGADRPVLPGLEDGRPVFEGPRPMMRDYTPQRYDATAGTLEVEFAFHEAGPASDWARQAAVGSWVGVAGPRGSMVVPPDLPWHVLMGDASALPAIVRRLAELPASTRAIVRVLVENPADQRPLTSAAALDVAWVDSLPAAARSLMLPEGAGYLWAAGEHSDMAAVRDVLRALPGADPRRMRVSAYWRRGDAGHHEELAD